MRRGAVDIGCIQPGLSVSCMRRSRPHYTQTRPPLAPTSGTGRLNAGRCCNSPYFVMVHPESYRKRGNWCKVFLTIFILLHNYDLQPRQHKPCSPIRHSKVSLALKARMDADFDLDEPMSQPGMVLWFEMTCNSLLAHFYYFCRRIRFLSVHDRVPENLDETSKELIVKLRVAIPEAGRRHCLPSLQALLTPIL
jgi:hypothetical protein